MPGFGRGGEPASNPRSLYPESEPLPGAGGSESRGLENAGPAFSRPRHVRRSRLYAMSRAQHRERESGPSRRQPDSEARGPDPAPPAAQRLN